VRSSVSSKIFIHPTADVSARASIGAGSKIWHRVHIREGATIGQGCVLGKDVYIDAQVRIGNHVKIQNGVSIYHGVTLEDGVFCGPHCVFTNDLHPRSINLDGSPQADWTLSETLVKSGASIGAQATLVCGITIGHWAMIGAGAVVTRDVPDYGLVYGNPARLRGFVCHCGEKLQVLKEEMSAHIDAVPMTCDQRHAVILIPLSSYQAMLKEMEHDSLIEADHRRG
jgi:UDP-2-acetamido-3-amino-2,3-dideoxy-glucuronate N-acetyltransferase